MIELTRSRKREHIHANFVSPRRGEQGELLLRAQRDIKRGKLKKHDWNSDFWKKAKDRLQIETLGKCAYCEAHVTDVAYGDVEHYRPKSRYWWLAYNYDNYLASCQLCNQRHKKDFFPIQGSKMKGPRVSKVTSDEFILHQRESLGPDPLSNDSVSHFLDAHREERPLLINPYFDVPSDYLAWGVDNDKGHVLAVPASSQAKPFLEAMGKYYGLNREQLLKTRYSFFFLFRTQKLALTQTTGFVLEQVQLSIERLLNGSFAGMLRYFHSQPLDDLFRPKFGLD